MVFFAILSLYLGATRASTLIHSRSLKNLLRNPMAFFDCTPLGRILNRFTQDVDEVDEELPSTIHALLNCLYMVYCFWTRKKQILFHYSQKLSKKFFSKTLTFHFFLSALFQYYGVLILCIGGFWASERMFRILVDSVVRCPMEFFDRTPKGRLLSRFSSDVYVLDSVLPTVLRSCLHCALQVRWRFWKWFAYYAMNIICDD